jgi:type I restriction enzyme S subunit
MSSVEVAQRFFEEFPAYSEYKDSGIDWLGKIPKHWILKPLFTLMKERNERNIGNKEQNILSLSYGKIIRRNVDDNFGLLPASFETYQIVQDGNIIMRLTDLQNDKRSLRIGLVKEFGIITSAYVCLEIIQELEISFAYSLLHSYDLTKIFYSLGGGVRQSMNYEDLKRLPILCPPLEEQKQIATFLDRATTEIDQIIEQQKQLITLLEEERTTVISHAVTKGLDPSVPLQDSGIEWLGKIPKHWDVKRLKHTCSVIKDGTHQPPQRTENGFPLLSVRNIIDGKFVNLEDDSLISEQDFKELQRSFIVQENDVLLAIVGATLGKVAIVEEMPPFTIQRSLAFFRPRSPILYYRYLSAFLQSSIFQRLLWKNVGFSAQPGIYLGVLGNLHTLIPPISEQQAIALFLDQETARIDEAINNVRSQIEKLEEYRTVLISDAVTGKIDVRGFNKE